MALTVTDVRAYAKDIPELNILLEQELQSSNELVTLAMRLAVDDYNTFPPVSQYSVDNFFSDSLLLLGTLYHLANSEAERQLRNQITFSAQGIQAAVDDKAQVYASLAQSYKAQFEQKSRELGQAMNMEAAWGGVHSPYAGINDHNFRN
jgi:hypothetical protein